MSLTKCYLGAAALLLFSFLWPSKTISLEEAIAKKFVEIEVASTGEYSGKCIRLNVNNVSGKKLNVEVPAGTFFEPTNGEEQNILMPKTQLLALERDQKRKFSVAGYCIEPHDASPSEESAFTIQTNTNATFDSIFHFLGTHQKLFKETDLMQSAMWAVTDPSEISAIYSSNYPKEASALRKYLCKLTGQEDVWYNTRNNYRLGADRRIVREPVLVNGKIELRIEGPSTVVGSIVNEAGEVVFTHDRKLDFPKGKVKFEFNLEVQNWDAGTYHVEYKQGDKMLFRQPFTI